MPAGGSTRRRLVVDKHMALQNDYPPMVVLEGRVLFDRQRRHLSTQDAHVELKEHEARLLSALLDGIQDKREIIALLWESRGVIVTENNYYKVVKGLRNAFEAVGLSADLLKTLPRVGVAFVGSFAPLTDEPTSSSALPQEPLAPPIMPTARSFFAKPPHHWWFGAMIVLMALLCGGLLLRSDNGFRLLGASSGIKVYVYKDPGVSMSDVLASYRRFALAQQNIRYLYYRAVGKNYIILACPTALPDGAESCVSLMQKNI
jgi:DNA-binding winged helix-turn-helix (wHTH) protein